MSLSQFHCTSRLYLDMHGLIFETSICYWQDQPGRPPVPPPTGGPARAGLGGVAQPRGGRGGRGPASPAVSSRRPRPEPRCPWFPRGRALRRSAICALRCTRVERMLSAVAVRPRRAAVSVVSPGAGSDSAEGSRKRASGAAFAHRRASELSSTDGGADPRGALGLSVVGRLGETVRLGLARTGRPAERRGGGSGESSARCVLRDRGFGAAGGEQRPPDAHRGCAGGALARGGLRMPFDQCGCSEAPAAGARALRTLSVRVV